MPPSQLPRGLAPRLAPKPIRLSDFTWHVRLIDFQPASYAFSKASNVVFDQPQVSISLSLLPKQGFFKRRFVLRTG